MLKCGNTEVDQVSPYSESHGETEKATDAEENDRSYNECCGKPCVGREQPNETKHSRKASWKS